MKLISSGMLDSESVARQLVQPLKRKFGFVRHGSGCVEVYARRNAVPPSLIGMVHDLGWRRGDRRRVFAVCDCEGSMLTDAVEMLLREQKDAQELMLIPAPGGEQEAVLTAIGVPV
jgi:hypothetical protein